MNGELFIEGQKVSIETLIALVRKGYIEEGGIGFSPRMRGPLRDALTDYIENNPVYRQYVQHISAPERHYNTLPWHAIGERNYAAWICVAASLPGSKLKVHGLDPRADRAGILLPMAFMILGATPYLWCDKMEKLADGAPLPKHIVSPTVMPSPVMFWSRETAYSFLEPDGSKGENNWICAFVSDNLGRHVIKTDLKPSPTTARLFLIGDWIAKDGSEAGLVSFSMALGKTWPDDYLNDPQTGVVLRRCAFLNSPFVRTNVERLAHHHRRQMTRAGIAPGHVEEKIHVVKLRRAAGSSPKPTGEPGTEGVEWKHHWWVNAFYRAQWYPSEQAHRVIWISPFIKGDLSKPLLEKVYAVVR
jgi:hypothetical protein